MSPAAQILAILGEARAALRRHHQYSWFLYPKGLEQLSPALKAGIPSWDENPKLVEAFGRLS